MTKRGWILFALLGFIWGLPYLFIRIAVEDLSPAVVVFGRVLLGAALLLPFAAKQGALGVVKTHAKWIFAFGFVEMALPFVCLGYAEQKISSSLAGLIIAAVPMTSALFARYYKLDDQWTSRRVVGMALGFMGVAALVGLDVRADSWFAVVLAFIAVTGYASGPVLITLKLSDEGINEVGVIAWAQAMVAALYLPLILWQLHTGAWHTSDRAVPLKAWTSVAILGVVCTTAAFILLFKLIAEVGPGRTTVITYINPAVAVTLGVLILNEPITSGLLIGFPMILLGSFIATRKEKQAA